MNLRRLQSIAVASSAVFLGLAILTIAGVQIVPRGLPGLVWAFHVLVAAVGFFAGIAATRRRTEIDVERWQRVEDPDLTSGEREHAHREAESELRRATSQFLLPGVALGGWLAYQLRPERPASGAAMTFVLGGETADAPSADESPAAALAVGAADMAVEGEAYTLGLSDLLIATPLLAFGLGVLWARYRAGRPS